MSLEIIKEFQTLIASSFASIIVLTYYFLKQRLDKEIVKRELFIQLNNKYDSLNDHLEELIHIEFDTHIQEKMGNAHSLDEVWSNLFESEPIRIPKPIAVTFDYVNLCSEQYYWYRKGFVDEKVWKCWKKGMKDWYKNSFFLQKVIKREKDNDASYYNDNFLDIFTKNK